MNLIRGNKLIVVTNLKRSMFDGGMDSVVVAMLNDVEISIHVLLVVVMSAKSMGNPIISRDFSKNG
jgi:hypothetical protein